MGIYNNEIRNFFISLYFVSWRTFYFVSKIILLKFTRSK
jgi:hypothetical protein